jgi:hypothetical protein
MGIGVQNMSRTSRRPVPSRPRCTGSSALPSIAA